MNIFINAKNFTTDRVVVALAVKIKFITISLGKAVVIKLISLTVCKINSSMKLYII